MPSYIQRWHYKFLVIITANLRSENNAYLKENNTATMKCVLLVCTNFKCSNTLYIFVENKY